MEINNFSDYLIYKDGRVYSKRRNIYLKPEINNGGYFRISLCHKQKKYKKFIHRLVAEHYILNPHNYPQVDHLDRNKLNNNIENLRWVDLITNNNNKGEFINNTSGHKYITKNYNKYRFSKTYNKKNKYKTFNSLTDALCYKYIFLLKLKSNIYIK